MLEAEPVLVDADEEEEPHEGQLVQAFPQDRRRMIASESTEVNFIHAAPPQLSDDPARGSRRFYTGGSSGYTADLESGTHYRKCVALRRRSS